MAAPATPSSISNFATPSSEAGFAGYAGMHLQLVPEHRIGGPPASARRRRMIKVAMFGVFVLSGWAAFAHPEIAARWSKAVIATIHYLMERPAAGAVTAAPALPPLHLLDVNAHAVEAAERVVATPPAIAAPEPEVAEEPTTPPVIEKLPPPVIDPADPYQARALAVGLHPGLSRALLSKFTQVDFENAGRAITSALAETPDHEVLIWPRRPSPGLAQFKIKFATSAAPDCRRYVVEIGRDGWMTSALPMEKCGIPIPRQAAATTGPRKQK